MNRNMFTHDLVRGLRLFVIAALLAGLALTVGPVAAAPVATITATNTNDGAPGLIDQAIVDAKDLPAAMASSEPNASQSPLPLLVNVVNGGFEVGDLTSWHTSGTAGRVEVLQASDFTTSAGPGARPTPTEGSYFALLSTGPGEVNPVAAGNIDWDSGCTLDYDTTILTKTFSLAEADVPVTLSFDWSFLTSEGGRGTDVFDDFFQVTLNGVVILSGSRPCGGMSPYPDVVPLDGISYQVEGGTFLTQGCVFEKGRSPFQTFSMSISNPVTYTLQFLVADQGDTLTDSGLLVDYVRLEEATIEPQPVLDAITAVQSTVDDIEAKLDPGGVVEGWVTSARDAVISAVTSAQAAVLAKLEQVQAQLITLITRIDKTESSIVNLYRLDVKITLAEQSTKGKDNIAFILTSFAGSRVDATITAVEVDGEVLELSEYDVTPVSLGLLALTLEEEAIPKKGGYLLLVEATDDDGTVSGVDIASVSKM